MNQSLTAAPTAAKGLKVKPRDFKANPRLLKEIGAENYDQFPDVSELQITLENQVEKLRE